MDAYEVYLTTDVDSTHTKTVQIDEIIRKQDLSAIFQPIVRLTDGFVIGYEGLIRGPAGTNLHSPLELFEAARECGLALSLEYLCRKIVLESFARLGIEGKLFLNVSQDLLLMEGAREGETLRSISDSGLRPTQVVIELTENSRAMDYPSLRQAADYYRNMGFQIAIDDLGEGFSSLRLWSELRPDFVKIDKHFIRTIQHDPVKLQFVRSIQEIASNAGCMVIAEGIEEHAELQVVRENGIAFGQGYLFACPLADPSRTIPKDVLDILQDSTGKTDAISSASLRRGANIAKLLKYVRPVRTQQTNEEVFRHFEQNPELFSMPVISDEGVPVGLISRYSMIDRFARPYRKELYGRKSCSMLMDAKPLVVDVAVTIYELSSIILDMEPYHLAAGFILTENGLYRGIGSGHDLLREITQMQIAAARYSNPLTMLPGNVPINEHIDLLLDASASFYTCYFDLDNFKPYNDVYGFRKGDEIIKLVGKLLEEASNADLDFVGHIGGDDFIALFQSKDWKNRCKNLLDKFAAAIPAFYEKSDLDRGGLEVEDRQGGRIFQPIISLSIGAVQVRPYAYRSHHEVAAAATKAKKEAKKTQGNSMFVERRAQE